MASMVTEIISGMGWPSSRLSSSIASTPALMLRVSWQVSSRRRSAPPSMSPRACSRKFPRSSSNVTPPVTLMAFVVGPIEPATKRGLAGAGKFVRGLPREFRRAAIDLACAVAQPVLREHQGRAAKGIRLDNVRAGLEILAVNSQHHVGARHHQILIAAFQSRPAEIGRRKVGLLQHGAHRAIQDEDALAEKFAEGQALLDQVSHVFRIIP